MEKNPSHLKLEDLFTKSKEKKIDLPTVQRGFVWKPYQIENLWDSLLRGYPIGAFVVSEKKEEGILNLLDGQQRATAICLGFYNPLLNNPNHVFKSSNENVMVFIDLDTNFKNNGSQRKYLFRVLTKSHPWGYQKTENQKTLDSKSIGEAISKYFAGNNSPLFNYDYLNQPLKNFWPYDSYRPVPFGLFIDAALKDKELSELRHEITEWEKNAFNYSPKSTEKLQEDDNYLKEVFDDVKKMLDKQAIPLSYLDYDRVFWEDEIVDTDDSENELADDIENLFIRLNSGGTAISGEELNYSILKSKISTELQDRIEKHCTGVLKASRFITLVYQLYKNETSPEDRISLKIAPRRFQREMYKPKDFQLYIERFLEDGVLKKAVDILRYMGDEDPGLPVQIIQNIAARAPEVFFALLYRIYIKEDKIEDSLRPYVLGIVTLFSWMGRGESQRDHSKLLQNIWVGIKHFEKERFWSAETVQMAMKPVNGREVLPNVPTQEELNSIIGIDSRKDLSKFKILSGEDGKFYLFIEKMFYNKELLLFAQRNALKRWFESIQIPLEDSNIPFDWDHIVPHDLIKKKRNIRNELKEWYHSNGNFRAWPYSLNRSDNNMSPFEKFNPANDVSWVESYCDHCGIEFNSLQGQLLSDSFCDRKWLNFGGGSKDLKNDKNAKKVLRKILERNIELCQHWYENHKIDDLMPDPLNNESDYVIEFFKESLDMRKWEIEGEDDSDESWFFYRKIENKQSLFIEINKDSPLGERKISFGLMDELDSLKKIKEFNKEPYLFETYEDYDYIFSKFTLLSFFYQARVELFEEFEKWVDNLPEKGLNKGLIVSGLKNSFK